MPPKNDTPHADASHDDASPRADASTAPDKNFSPLVWLLLLALVNLLGPFLPIPNLAAAIAGRVVVTLGYVAVVVAFALGIARQKLPIPRALMGLSASILAWVLVEYALFPFVGRALSGLDRTRPPTAAQRMMFSGAVTVQDLALLCGATYAGTLLSRLIRHANMIGPIGAAIALIDIWGVLFGGIVSQLLTNKSTQPLAEKAMAAGPKLGGASRAATGGGYSIALPDIGVGDFLFIALLLSVLVNLSMNWRTSARLMWALVCFALLAIQFLPFFPALPGLLFIGAAAVLPNWKYFQFTREERFALLYAGVFVLLLTIGLYFGFQSMIPKK